MQTQKTIGTNDAASDHPQFNIREIDGVECPIILCTLNRVPNSTESGRVGAKGVRTNAVASVCGIGSEWNGIEMLCSGCRSEKKLISQMSHTAKRFN